MRRVVSALRYNIRDRHWGATRRFQDWEAGASGSHARNNHRRRMPGVSQGREYIGCRLHFNPTFQGLKAKRFGLWSASGESGAAGGEERLAHRSRSGTSRRRAADGSARDCGSPQMPLVTSARIFEVERRRRGGQGDGQPVERSKPRVGHGGNQRRFRARYRNLFRSDSRFCSPSSFRDTIGLFNFSSSNAN